MSAVAPTSTGSRPAPTDPGVLAQMPRFAQLQAGRFAKAQAAHATLRPRLAPATRSLGDALRGGDPERIAFELRRLDALDRAVGAVFDLLDESLKEFQALAGDAEYDTVQHVIGEHVELLSRQRRALTAWTTGSNALKTRATKAIEAAERAQSKQDAKWEALKSRVETLHEQTEGFWEHTNWLEKLVNNASGNSSLLDGAQKKVDQAAQFADERLAEARALERELTALAEHAAKGQASPDLAAQLTRQIDGVRRRLGIAELRLKQINVAKAVLRVRREDLDTRGIALALDVPSQGVVKVAKWLAGRPVEQMRALAELHKTYALDNTPKAMLALLKKKQLVH